MAAPFFYLRFSFITKSLNNFHFKVSQSHLSEQHPCGLLQHFLSQQLGLSRIPHHCQSTHSRGLPGYNYGLPGKGKSRKSTGQKWLPDVTGELLFGLHPVYLALKARRRKAFYHLHVDEKHSKSCNKVHPMLDSICQLAIENDIDIKFVRKRDLDLMSGNRPHQGVCLDAEELTCMSWDGSVKPDWHDGDRPLWLYLHNIQDPMNVGAILRSSHFMGVDKVIVPRDESCRLSPVVSKASSGAMEVTDVLQLPQGTTGHVLCQWWKQHGGMVLGACGRDADGYAPSVALEHFTLSTPSLLALGNEGTGLSEDIAKVCDVRLHIESCQVDYHKEIDSLNVSVATGILLHWLQSSRLKSNSS